MIKYFNILYRWSSQYVGGYEPDPPKFIENNLEFLWRLRFDTKRRLKTAYSFNVLLSPWRTIAFEYKKYDKNIKKLIFFVLIDIKILKNYFL